MNAASPESDPAERFLTDFEGVIRDLGERLRPRKWISEREQKSVSRAVKVIQDLETEILDRLKHQEKGSPEELFDLRRLGWLSRLSPEEIVREPAYLEQLRELIQAHARKIRAPRKSAGNGRIGSELREIASGPSGRFGLPELPGPFVSGSQHGSR